MSFLIRSLMVIFLLAILAVPAAAQMAPPPALPGGIQWAPVPGAPGVQYAPDLGQDIFRYGQAFYSLYQGLWYLTHNPQGPWVQTQNIPQPFYQIQSPYFHNPPGWARGRKTGWGGAPLPPGQMKKYEQGPFMPPGQMKKMYR